MDAEEIPENALESKSVSDPAGSIRVDTEILLTTLHAPSFYVSGLVYDVATGTIEVVVPPTPLSHP